MQVAEHAISVLDWHAFPVDNVPRERLGHLIGRAFYLDLVAVEVGHLSLVAKESLLQSDVHVHVQVVLHASEHAV